MSMSLSCPFLYNERPTAKYKLLSKFLFLINETNFCDNSFTLKTFSLLL